MFLIGGAGTVLVRSAIVCPTVLALADHLVVIISIKGQRLSLSFECHFQHPVQLSIRNHQSHDRNDHNHLSVISALRHPPVSAEVVLVMTLAQVPNVA